MLFWAIVKLIMWLLVCLFFVLGRAHGLKNSSTSIKLVPNEPQVILLHANSTLTLNVDPNNQTDFWVFEVHTQNSHLVLTDQLDFKSEPKIHVNRFHNGFVLLNDGHFKNESREIYLKNPNESKVSGLVLARGYSAKSPVPGMCRKTNATVINHRPELDLYWDYDVVKVNFSNSGLLNTPSSSCDMQNNFQYSVYLRFLKHQNYDEDYYLTQLAETMLLEDKIVQYGSLVSEDFVHAPDLTGVQEALFSAYPGTVAIYSVIVKHGNDTSVYVTTSTYACNLNRLQPMNCENMPSTNTKIVCSLSLLMGLFLALFGHRHFPWSQFFFGCIAGGLVGYILLVNVTSLEYSWVLSISCAVSVGSGVAWMCQWIMLGIPIVAMVLPTLITGLLLACVLFFFPFLNTATFMSDSAYWGTVAGIAISVPLLLLSFAKTASILSCAIIGTFAVIVPLDHYMGSSLKYILVNLARRATIQDFNMAFLLPPFQSKDIALTAGWLCMALVSLIFQHVRERRRAPFPPNFYLIWRWRGEEQDEVQTPLINNDYDPSNQHVFNQEFYAEIRDAARQAILEAAAEGNGITGALAPRAGSSYLDESTDEDDEDEEITPEERVRRIQERRQRQASAPIFRPPDVFDPKRGQVEGDPV